MISRRLVTKIMHRLIVLDSVLPHLGCIFHRRLYAQHMQLPAPTHDMPRNTRIVHSEAVWHAEFDATSNLRLRLGRPPHPALGCAALDLLSTLTLGTRHMR